MKKLRLGFAGFYLVALLLSMTAFQAAAQDANFVGTWEMTTTGGGRGGGQGGVEIAAAVAAVRSRSPSPKTVTISMSRTRRRAAKTPLTLRFQATRSHGPSSARAAMVTP